MNKGAGRAFGENVPQGSLQLLGCTVSFKEKAILEKDAIPWWVFVVPCKSK